MGIHPNVVLVTGGARGIGRAVAGRFGQDGWTVVVGDVDGQAAAGTAASIGVDHRSVDVSDPGSVDRFVGDTAARYGRIDVVVHCAGLFHVAPLLEHDLESWRRVFAVNVEGSLNVIQRAASVMKAQEIGPGGWRGRIVTLSSPAAVAPRPLLAAYGASKAALDHLSRTAAADLGPLGVWVTVVYPTNVAEGMWGRLPGALARATDRTEEEVTTERLAQVPSGRFQPVAEVADVVHYAATAGGLNGKVVWAEAHVADL